MKKNLLFLATAMVIAAMATSCGKDTDEGGAGGDGTRMVGTKWLYVEQWSDPEGIFTDSVTLAFLGDRDGEQHHVNIVRAEMVKREEETIPFTYTYQSPNGTITVKDDGETATLSFSVQGDTLWLKYTNDYYPVAFVRQ